VATFSHIQGKLLQSVNSGGLTMSGSLTAAPTPGNIVCVGIKYQPSTSQATFPTVKDGNNNSYTVIQDSGSVDWANSGYAYLAYLLSAPANAHATITATFPANVTFGSIRAEEFSCSAPGCTFDKYGVGGTVSGGGNVVTPSVTPTNTGSLLYCFACPSGTISSANPPWTQDAAGIDGQGADGEYILSSSAGATAANFTAGSSYDSMALVIAPPQSGPIYMIAG
jgi:hypothetical protein